MATTIKDIARLVGVSPATVSRVLSNKSAFYGSKTADKVRTAAKKLGYKKNINAVELVTQQSNVIAAVVNSVKTNYSDQIIQGIQAEATLHNFNVIIVYASSNDPVEQQRALSTVIDRPVRGILLLSMALSKDNLKLLQSSNIPFCFLSIGFDDDNLPSITSDDWQIGYQATKVLLNNGHHSIGIAAVDKYSHTGRFRIAGYQSALKEAGISFDASWIQLGDYSYMAGQTAMRNYGAQTELTGVVAASDMAAIGILNQARDLGLTVPDDLSIISIDGTEMCSLVQPQLTSISQNFYAMGVAGVRHLQKNNASAQQIVPFKIMKRESV